MQSTVFIALLLLLTSLSYFLGRNRALAFAAPTRARPHSLPSYHGVYVALWFAVPALLVLGAWLLLQPFITEWLFRRELPADVMALDPVQRELLLGEARNAMRGLAGATGEPAVVAAIQHYGRIHQTGLWAAVALALLAGALGATFAHRRISPLLRARTGVERFVRVLMIGASAIAVLTTAGIVLSLIFEALRFFSFVSPLEFFFGLHWSPQIALRADQAGASGAFGAVPVFAGTLLITVIAMVVAVPIGMLSAIYMSDYATPRVRAVAKPILEILAGIPTVVYGFFAALTVAPFIRGFGESIGLDASSESALAAGVVMGIMIIPFVSSLSDDVMNAVPQTLRDGSFALGATKSETIRQVVIPAALPGIVGAVLLAVSRAIGETMIVVMAAGLAANLTANPFDAVTTVTVQIVTLLVGDQEFDSPKTLAAFALGLVLFVVTLILNVIALRIVRRYREKYD